MSNRPEPRQDRTVWFAVGGIALAALCCAAPALIAGGVLASAVGFLSGGYVIGIVVLLAFIGLVIAVNRRKPTRFPGPDSRATHSGGESHSR